LLDLEVITGTEVEFNNDFKCREDSLEGFKFSTNADKLKATAALQKLINLKTKALQLQLTALPQYQCYNEIKDLTKALSKSKSCTKGYKKVKT